MSEVLVTGGAGFIGSHVVDRLLDEGHQVTVVDNLSTGKTENVQPGTRLATLDISDRIPRGNYEYIFHLAAKARVQPSIADPIAWNEANVTGTLNVLEMAREVGAKVIFSSSSSVYGDTEKLPINEEDPKNPKSPYALQKWIGEQYLELYNKLFGLEYVALRYFNVYGERQVLGGAYSAVMGIFLDQKSKGEPMTIRGDGENRRDFTYVGDVADANLLARDWPTGAYNIGAGNNYSVNEVADLVGGERVNVDPVVEPHATLADNSKARAQGWNPQGDLERWINANIG